MIKSEIQVLDLVPDVAVREFPILATRQMGNRFLEQFRIALSQTHNDRAIKISFHGIELMDASFADEVFGVIGVERSENKTENIAPFYITDINPTNLDNLNMALDSRLRRHKGLRNCVMPVMKSDGKLDLVGKFEEHVEQTFELLRLGKDLTTSKVGTILKLSDAAASTRLKVLFDLGLALRSEVRDEQGRQFIYRWLV